MKSCGTCDLYGERVYRPEVPWPRQVCCADVAMDLPDAFDGNLHMKPDDGCNCPIWTPTTQNVEN